MSDQTPKAPAAKAEMGGMTAVTAADDHMFQAYHVAARGKRRGGVVVVQEIFGVNSHIRALADSFAQRGYETYAPALFDRVERRVELGYGPQDIERGRALRAGVDWTQAVLDVQACVASLRGYGEVGVVGYCWGGSVAWQTACRALGVSAAVCYYGGQIAAFADLAPRCPVMMHFGERDHSIPIADVEKIRAAQPAVTIHTYAAAGHGFHCDQRQSYDAAAAQTAGQRTLDFLAEHVG